MIYSYITKPKSIKHSDFHSHRSSLCPKDYRKLLTTNSEAKKLSTLLKNCFQGQEIGSEAYLRNSKFRFLKTVNITESFTIDETSIEFCLPLNTKKPKQGNILIVKDGAGNGLGEVCYYNLENKDATDSISAGVLSIDVKKEFRFYVLGILKTQHFKDFVNLNTPEGSTIRHSKKIAIDYYVPFPSIKHNNESEKIIDYVSLIVQNIIHKEEEVKKRLSQINNAIVDELMNNQKGISNNMITRISEIKNNSLRFDAGMYSNEYKQYRNLISNYSNGFFNIPLDNLKSGSTPDIRIFSTKAMLKWVTPTDIKDEGFFAPTVNISMPTSNNLSENAVLFINRTSKGKKGEYVGIACYYDHSYYGDGHHNQGIYRVDKYSEQKKQFIVAFMNATIMRKICGYTSQGTKMKEMKMNNFSELIFPEFPDKKLKEISTKYFNNYPANSDLKLENYLPKEKTRNSKLGIFQLNLEIQKMKEKLVSIVDKIIKEEPIKIEL